MARRMGSATFIPFVVTAIGLCGPWAVAAQAPAGAEGPAEARKTPSLIGQPLAKAEQLLRLSDLECAAGVFYLHAQVWRESLESNTVYLQSPQPNLPALQGGAVAVWTLKKANKDQRIVRTPNFQGKSPAEAARLLADAELLPMRAPAADGALPEPPAGWVVVDQYPRPSQPVYQKTAVHLRYRPAATKVP